MSGFSIYLQARSFSFLWRRRRCPRFVSVAEQPKVPRLEYHVRGDRRRRLSAETVADVFDNDGYRDLRTFQRCDSDEPAVRAVVGQIFFIFASVSLLLKDKHSLA